MLIAYIPLIVCIIGLLMWALTSRTANPPTIIGEAGRLMFFAGLLVTCFALASHAIKIP